MRNPTKSAESSNRSGVQIEVIIPPDGGWGWIIVLSCFFVNFVIDGTTYCFGIFIEDIANEFKVHPTEVAIISSLLSGFYYLAGPLSCALTNRFGFRFVGILGAITASTCFVVASYMKSLLSILMIIGVLAGIAFNMIYTASLLIVGFYFEKWRALTTSISLTGTAAGIMITPLIMDGLLKHYDWRMKFRALSIANLFLLLLVATFKSIKPTRIIEVTVRRRDSQTSVRTVDNQSIKDYLLMDDDTSVDIESVYLMSFPDRYSFVSTKQSDIFKLKKSGPTVSIMSSNTFNMAHHYALDSPSFILSDQNCCTKLFCYMCGTIEKRHARPMYRDDIFYGGSVFILPEYKQSNILVSIIEPSSESTNIVYHLSVSKMKNDKEMRQIHSKKYICCHESFVRVFKMMLDYRLFKSYPLDLVLFSGFLTMIGMYAVYIFIQERVKELGFGSYWGGMMLTIIGLSNAIGRIACGVIGTIPHVDNLITSYVTLCIASGAIIVSCFVNLLWIQITCMALFGLNMASFTTLRTVLLVEMVGLANLTNSFGIMNFLYGIGSFIGIPLAGYLAKTTGQYSYCFLFSGITLFLSGVVLIPVKKVAKLEKNPLRS